MIHIHELTIYYIYGKGRQHIMLTDEGIEIEGNEQTHQIRFNESDLNPYHNISCLHWTDGTNINMIKRIEPKTQPIPNTGEAERNA
jgi:hypothetical protein